MKRQTEIIIKVVLVVTLFIFVGFWMSLYHGGFVHVNAKYLRATRVVQVDDAVDDMPSLREALEHPGKNVSVSTEGNDALRQLLNENRTHVSGYVVYEDACYYLYVHPTDIKAQKLYDSFVTLTDDDLADYPYVLEAVHTNGSIHITARQYEKMNELINYDERQAAVTWNGSHYVLRVSMA